MSPPRQRPHLTSERQHEAYDEGWAAGRESIAASLADAFVAGAMYIADAVASGKIPSAETVKAAAAIFAGMVQEERGR